MSIQDWTDIVDVRRKRADILKENSEEFAEAFKLIKTDIAKTRFEQYCKKLEKNINLPFNFL